MAHDVFISHSSTDKTVADAAVAALERAKIRCWVAPRDIIPGQDWGASIIDAIRGSRLMIVIFSSQANASVQVKREVERAVHQAIPIIPLRIENIEPTGSMEFFLSTPHWLDAMSTPLEATLVRLVQTVQLILLGPAAVPAQTFAQPYPQTQTAFPTAPAKPLPVWLIPAIVGGLIVLVGLFYLQRALQPTGLAALGGKVANIQLFEAAYGAYPKPHRIYVAKFATIGTRYIDWEVNLTFPKSKEETKVEIEATWYKPDGTIEAKQTDSGVVQPGATALSLASGWGSKDGGVFHAGTYRIDFAVAGSKFASKTFDVYEGEAPATNYIQAIDATISKMQFYEGATGSLPKEQRQYRSTFPASSRYVCWEMTLNFPMPLSRLPFTVQEVWYRPDGAEMTDHNFGGYIEPTWTFSWQTNCWGTPKGGTYTPGKYHIAMYVDKRKVQDAYFDVTSY